MLGRLTYFTGTGNYSHHGAALNSQPGTAEEFSGVQHPLMLWKAGSSSLLCRDGGLGKGSVATLLQSLSAESIIL